MKELKSLRAFQKIEKDKKKLSEIKRHKLSRKISCFAALIIFTAVIGGTGGIILDRFGLPYLLVRFPELNKYGFLKSANEQTIIIEKTVETKISGEQAEIAAIKKVSPSLVSVVFLNEAIKDNKNIDFSNSNANKKIGFIFTSDGLVIAKTDRQRQKNELIKIKFRDGKILGAQWVGFDKSSGIAVLKVEDNNLPMVTFANFDNLELGEKLIAVSDNMIMDTSVSQITSGYFSANPKRIIITKNLSQIFYGVPLINIKGEIVGISEKENLVIPINELREFVDGVLEK